LIWLLLAVILVLGWLAEHYRSQRDDLATYLVYMHPEDFPDEAPDEPSDSDDDLLVG
jgi:hypothetical protein